MFLGESFSDPSAGLARQLIREFDEHEHLVVSGENGVGKSHMLAQLASLLEDRGSTIQRIRCGDRESALRLLRETDPAAVFIIDELEVADLELLRAIIVQVKAGGRTISALTSSNADTNYVRDITSALQESSAGSAVSAEPYRHKLEGMTALELRRFIHANASAPLTSYAVAVLSSLAQGRPAWALDLITLYEAGFVTLGPTPAINPRRLQELSLPGLRSAAASVGDVGHEAAAAAVALSEIDPLDPSQAADLTSERIVHTLIDHGVMIPFESTGTFSVPVFLAAALDRLTTLEAVADARFRIASGLLLQESLGLPLSITDSLFCSRVLSHIDNTGTVPSQPLLNLVLRTADETVDFTSQGNARALLHRLANHGVQLSGLLGVRTMTLIGGAQQGLARIDASPLTGDAERIGGTFLRAILEARGAATISMGRTTRILPASPASNREDAPESAFEQVSRLWNSSAPLVRELDFLRATMHSEEHDAVRLAAGALYKHELLWRGRRLSDADQAHFLALMQRTMLTGNMAYRDIVDTAFITYACSMLVVYDYLDHAEELQRVISDHRTAPFHQQWLTQLIAAAGALSCGLPARAALEWQHFTQSVPRFLPVRLRARLAWFADAIESAADRHAEVGTGSWQRATPTNNERARQEWTLTHFVDYLSGDYDRMPPAPTTELDEPHVPVIPIMYQHLAASKALNPAELQRVAAKLFELRLGGPALAALTEARSTLVKRRAAGGVTRCDQQILMIEEELLNRYPWLRPEELPRTTNPSLTPRELAAAMLAAQGLSNMEVAVHLDCSVRTVESHLSQARAKLGITSRREFAHHPQLNSRDRAGT